MRRSEGNRVEKIPVIADHFPNAILPLIISESVTARPHEISCSELDFHDRQRRPASLSASDEVRTLFPHLVFFRIGYTQLRDCSAHRDSWAQVSLQSLMAEPLRHSASRTSTKRPDREKPRQSANLTWWRGRNELPLAPTTGSAGQALPIHIPRRRSKDR